MPLSAYCKTTIASTLTSPDGSPLPTDELNRKLAELRQEGASWVKSGRTPPNAKYAGQTVFLKDPILNEQFPDGVYINLHGYPDFRPHAVRPPVELPTSGEREVDFRVLNKMFQSDPLWGGKALTPEGYVWHHVEGGNEVMLIPWDIHHKLRHAGGIGTGLVREIGR